MIGERFFKHFQSIWRDGKIDVNENATGFESRGETWEQNTFRLLIGNYKTYHVILYRESKGLDLTGWFKHWTDKNEK